MLSEMDLRVQNERRKDFERAVREHRWAREAQGNRRRASSKRLTARLVALFL
jgi:hypothetical protein